MVKAVVIGSGFGGLAVAIRLQSQGFQVTILEKNEKIGGHAYQFIKQGYTFDMGPSIITELPIIQDIFSRAGKKIEDYLDIVPLNPYYRIYFHDKSYIDYSGDREDMVRQMSIFSVDDARNYDSFMKYTSELYKVVITNKLASTPFTFKRLLTFLPTAFKLKIITPAYKTVAQYFKHPKNRFVFSFHSLFVGGNPFIAPSIYLMIPYLEKVGGIWFSKGGMYSLVKAMEKIFLELGGTIYTNSEAKEIEVDKGIARSVKTSEITYEADLVVSNAHIAHTMKDLIPSSHRKKWTDTYITSKKYSMSTVLIFLGVKKQYPELMHHTLILSERYKELVKDIFERKVLAQDFSMYLHVPSRTDPMMAPEGCESMYVLIPVPNLNGDTDWNTELRPYTDRIIAFLEEDFGLTDLRKNIEVLEIFGPNDFEQQRNNYLGAAWSFEPRLLQSASFRPHNKNEDIKNLYMVGASTHPGAGVPGVLLSAEATEKLIREDFNIHYDR